MREKPHVRFIEGEFKIKILSTSIKVYNWLEECLEIQAINNGIISKYVPPHVIKHILLFGGNYVDSLFGLGSH